ncbi:RNA polymerase subunit sigma [Streptomyces sp. NTH33]|nr:RNA polymerase subunit sigma [Streptomyces sp. NTH33]
MAACTPGAEKTALRKAVITAYLPVARRLARRYGSPPQSREDLFQVACVGLVKAVNRFDPSLGHVFLAYAVPTIDGELKRYLRDHTWKVHVPRRVQEKHRRVRRAQDGLARNGRVGPCSTHDIQRRTGIGEHDIQQALQADQARNPVSMDERRALDRGTSLAESLGAEDPTLELVTDLVALGSLISQLPDGDRTVLELYYLRSFTQRQVADAVGISQMHVSRLLNRTCAFLRRSLLAS